MYKVHQCFESDLFAHNAFLKTLETFNTSITWEPWLLAAQ